jgi:DNA-nicking Smr family endonuclease
VATRDDDDSAFEEAMRGARPLPAGHGRVPASGRAAAPARGAAAKPSPATFIVERSGDSIVGRAPDVAAKEVRSLRAGERDVEGRIDLHHRDRASAVRDLETFLAGGRARGARVVLVIHGRGHGSDPGGPVLRPAVWDWLGGPRAERCGVMAFVSAPPRHGGDGATLVLLRRR